MTGALDEDETRGETRTGRRLTTAGRLLRAVIDGGGVRLPDLATRLGVRVRALEHCCDGTGSLEPEVQMKLAALVLLLAPEHERMARRLYGQAQSALRVQRGSVEAHLVYPRLPGG